MRAAMDGTSIRRIVHVEIRTPNGLALDYENRLVYWADGLGDQIGVVNYDGR